MLFYDWGGKGWEEILFFFFKKKFPGVLQSLLEIKSFFTGMSNPPFP